MKLLNMSTMQRVFISCSLSFMDQRSWQGTCSNWQIPFLNSFVSNHLPLVEEAQREVSTSTISANEITLGQFCFFFYSKRTRKKRRKKNFRIRSTNRGGGRGSIHPFIQLFFRQFRFLCYMAKSYFTTSSSNSFMTFWRKTLPSTQEMMWDSTKLMESGWSVKARGRPEVTPYSWLDSTKSKKGIKSRKLDQESLWKTNFSSFPSRRKLLRPKSSAWGAK